MRVSDTPAMRWLLSQIVLVLFSVEALQQSKVSPRRHQVQRRRVCVTSSFADRDDIQRAKVRALPLGSVQIYSPFAAIQAGMASNCVDSLRLHTVFTLVFEQAFLMRDQSARMEKLGEGLSIADKEAILDDTDTAAEDLAEEAEAVATGGRQEDPILGELLVDLGEKQVYLAEVPKLMRLPVWEKQRVYRPERAKKIALDKLRKKTPTAPISFPGAIALYEKAWEPPLREDLATCGDSDALAEARKRYGIIDGQHRVGALRVLYGKGEFDGRVLLEVYPLQSADDIGDLFADINKAEPLKDVDLPGMVSDFERETLQRVVAALQTSFPEMFKESTKCRKPHLNQDNLRDAIYSRGVVERHGHNDEEELLAWILTQNDKLGKRTDKEWIKRNPKSPSFRKAVAKARNFEFWLGLEDGWLDL